MTDWSRWHACPFERQDGRGICPACANHTCFQHVADRFLDEPLPSSAMEARSFWGAKAHSDLRVLSLRRIPRPG
jgi:hypothetical protein